MIYRIVISKNLKVLPIIFNSLESVKDFIHFHSLKAFIIVQEK